MEKIILENPEDGNDTKIADETASRGLYALLAVLAPAAGTLTALILAITYAAANLNDVFGYSAEEIKKINADWDWYLWFAEFRGKHTQADFVSHGVTLAAITGLIMLAAVIGLFVMTGRFSRNEGSIKLNWFDRLWSELHLAAACGAAAAAVFAAAPVAQLVPRDNKFGPVDLSSVYTLLKTNNYWYGISNNMVFWYCTAGIALSLTVTVFCCVTLVKKIKAHQLLRCSLIGKLFAFLGRGASHAGRGVAKAGKGLAAAGKGIARRNRNSVRSFSIPSDTDRLAAYKLMLKYSLIAAVLILLPEFWFFTFNDYFWLAAIPLVSIAIAIYLIIRKVGKLAEIRAGVIEVKSGNLKHKITVKEDESGPKTDLDKLASDINHISEATNAAVQNEIKNQRLKTDLISNVSHDLKTPLTSMISYLDIIEKEGLESPDAPAHLAIVREKTDRLRTLTEELFEAAKASSGNIPCEIVNIDAAALIDQSLAEMGDRLSKKDLIIKKNIKAGNTMVRADGKLLYRVFENLLSNISKYALDKSRVYIDVTEPPLSPGRLLIEVKNISKDELNISPDELMERFTRGDSSRNTEGSGLGLAIAKDLTTLMGGVFDISIDGDMFKASILLNAGLEA